MTLLRKFDENMKNSKPLTEGSGVDGDDGILDERLRSHELVIRRIVDGIDDTGFARDGCNLRELI